MIDEGTFSDSIAREEYGLVCVNWESQSPIYQEGNEWYHSVEDLLRQNAPPRDLVQNERGRNDRRCWQDRSMRSPTPRRSVSVVSDTSMPAMTSNQ